MWKINRLSKPSRTSKTLFNIYYFFFIFFFITSALTLLSHVLPTTKNLQAKIQLLIQEIEELFEERKTDRLHRP